jgi:peptidoglycan/LPS O-acetylase OafA/YrhL
MIEAGYRRDIDGLRSIAILPVALYHASLGPFTGGFVGVDVFFVISGFLITRSILARMEEGTFTIGWFYERRARRLLPALFFTILITLLASLILLSPEDLAEASVSVLSALLFVSNMFFHWKIDYFSQDAELMPFLHTWSLAVEEQFYIFWPLLLMAVWTLPSAIRERRFFQATALLAAVSFLTSIYAVHVVPSAAFYMLPFRFWELALGALAYLAVARWNQPNGSVTAVMSFAGMSLVVVPMFLLTPDSRFPGFAALPVVFGTALLLMAGANDVGIIQRLLSSAPMVYIGKISYSLYLLHWPVLALFRNYQTDVTISANDAWLLLALSLGLASFSYHFVETPFRKRASIPLVIRFSAGTGVGLAVVAAALVVLEGLPKRSGNLPQYAASRSVMWDWPCEARLPEIGQTHCVFGANWEDARSKVVLWGDSHADHFAPLVQNAITGKDTAVLLYRVCPPFLDDMNVRRWHKGSDRFSLRCGQAHASFLLWLRDNATEIDAVIMAAAWSGYPSSLYHVHPSERDRGAGAHMLGVGLDATLSKMPPEIPVRILSDVPRPRENLLHCLFEDSVILRRHTDHCEPLLKEDVVAWHRATSEVLFSVTEKHPHAIAFDMVERICDTKTCPIFLQGRLLYRDSNHIRRNLTQAELDEMIARTGLREIIEDAVDPVRAITQ